jgi:hypothetical protein
MMAAISRGGPDMERVLRWIVAILLIVAAVGATLYARRTNPIQFVSGRQLTGEVVSEPVSDWSFAKDVPLVAIETRPGAPYSVTTWCFVHEGKLYIPASAGSTKTWTHFAAADPRVRVKIGDKIYPGIATRITDDSLREPMREIARAKYNLPEQMPANMGAPSDVWLFRIDSPLPSAAAAEPPDVATGNP